MKKITAIVEFADNNLACYLQEVDGIVAFGKSLDELKKAMEDSIKVYIETCREYGEELPDALDGEFYIVYKFDLMSFLNAFSDILSKSGLEKITGIHQKQLWHYSSGKSKPRQATINKVSESVREFGRQLQEIEFV